MTFLFPRRLLLIVALISLVTITLPTVASAGWLADIGIKDDQIIPKDCTDQETGDNVVEKCNLDDVFQLLLNVVQLILALTGTAALLMFTYGGIIFIIAGGNAERISKATEILKMATIGLIIVLGAWLIVNTVILTVTGCKLGSTAKIFVQCSKTGEATDGTDFNLEPTGQ